MPSFLKKLGEIIIDYLQFAFEVMLVSTAVLFLLAWLISLFR